MNTNFDNPIIKRALETQKNDLFKKIIECIRSNATEEFLSIQDVNKFVRELSSHCTEYNNVMDLLDPNKREPRFISF